nr:MAG TPA: hypothetical protein [Caudoviricetes sp.]DAN71837.1 MAG TPA: hypothetical protein [Caudoviricetes sp.]
MTPAYKSGALCRLSAASLVFRSRLLVLTNSKLRFTSLLNEVFFISTY